jgi:hypothetical protein
LLLNGYECDTQDSRIFALEDFELKFALNELEIWILLKLDKLKIGHKPSEFKTYLEGGLLISQISKKNTSDYVACLKILEELGMTVTPQDLRDETWQNSFLQEVQKTSDLDFAFEKGFLYKIAEWLQLDQKRVLEFYLNVLIENSKIEEAQTVCEELCDIFQAVDILMSVYSRIMMLGPNYITGDAVFNHFKSLLRICQSAVRCSGPEHIELNLQRLKECELLFQIVANTEKGHYHIALTHETPTKQCYPTLLSRQYNENALILDYETIISSAFTFFQDLWAISSNTKGKQKFVDIGTSAFQLGDALFKARNFKNCITVCQIFFERVDLLSHFNDSEMLRIQSESLFVMLENVMIVYLGVCFPVYRS